MSGPWNCSSAIRTCPNFLLQSRPPPHPGYSESARQATGMPRPAMPSGPWNCSSATRTCPNFSSSLALPPPSWLYQIRPPGDGEALAGYACREGTHPSTNAAQSCLTSVIGRELVFSTWYGRRHS